MKVIVSNYRTGSTTLAMSLGGTGQEHLHEHREGQGVKPKFIGPNHEKVFKVMPNQWDYEEHWDEFKKLYLEPAEKIYITARKDFDAQVTSIVYSATTFDWHPHQKDLNSEIKDLNQEEYINWGGGFANKLLKNLEWQRKVYEEFDCELVWLEDRYNKEVAYKRKYDIEIPEFYFSVIPEDYFNGKCKIENRLVQNYTHQWINK